MDVALSHQQRLSDVRAILLARAPYYAAAVFDMVPVFRPGFGTMAVDQHWRLYFDPELDWPLDEQAAVLEHEVSHLLRDHAGRFADAPYSNSAINVATDLEINDDLRAAGVPIPDFGCWPSKMGFPDGLLAEQYIDMLDMDDADTADPGDGSGDGSGGAEGDGSEPGRGSQSCDGCGSGAGGTPEPWELPADDSDHPGRSAAQQVVTRTAVAVAIEQHVANRGTVPAGLERWAAALRKPAKVAWQQVLASTVRSGIGAVRGDADYTYRRTSRRRVPGTILPSMMSPKPKVAIVIDTSGSMSDGDLADCLVEVNAVIRRAGIRGDDLRVYSCDAAVGRAQKVNRVEQVSLSGGGGTDMTVGIDAALNNKTHRPHVIVVLSDGYTPWPLRPPESATVIAALCRRTEDPPSWIKTVYVGSAAEQD